MSELSDLQKRIAKRSRKVGMLVELNRSPDDAVKIRNDFKRREKLSEQRAVVAERRKRLNR